jgi:type II secretory pathway pseudopilin PulG
MRKERGMTLIELVLYFALAVVAGVLLWSVNNLVWGGQRAVSSTYLVSGETEKAIEWIRRDVSETALASIEVFPNPANPGEAPGMSLVSNRAYDPEQNGRPLVNRWGAPQWDKHVLYTLERENATAQTGNLVRWEREIVNKNFLPVACEVLPSSGGKTKQKVLLRDVLAPNLATADFGPAGSGVTDGFGGFRMQFVRRPGGSGADTHTAVNPRQGNPVENTRMLECELKLLQQEQSKPHYYSIKFKVAAFH